MDDFGNILYFIFIALSLVGGLWQNFNKQKAKKKEESARSIPKYEDDFIDKFEPIDQEEVLENEREARETIQAMKRKTDLVKKDRRIKRRNDVLLEAESVEEEEAPAFDLKDFDARKAVIYSDILNPPYL